MNITITQHTLVTKSGNVSAEVYEPTSPKALFVFAHGAGAGMHHPFMKALSTELANLGIATLRYNFLYMEQKKKRPDFPAVAHLAVAAAVEKAHALFPALPILAGGKSFGGRMTSHYFSAVQVPFVKGLVFVGFPLHPAGKPGIDRAVHLEKINTPMLFLQGNRDTLAQWDLIEGVCKKLPSATLIKLEGADHSFKASGKNLIPVLASETVGWLTALR